MAGKVLSIEVGYSITRVVEMDYEAKNAKIHNAFSFETPPDTLTDEGVHANEAMISAMKKAMKLNGVHTNRAVFSVSSARIANRDVTIPLVKDNKIKQLLIANSKDYFPVDLSQYELVYRIIDRMKEQKEIKLSVFAVPRPLIASYQQLARAWGMQLLNMDYSGNSVYQAMLRTMDKALSITLRVDDRSSMLTIVKDGRAELQRIIGYGIDDALEVVRASDAVGEHVSYLEALEVMQNRSCLNEQLRPEVHGEEDDWNSIGDEDLAAVREPATRALSMLVGNISRVLDYYTSRNAEVNIEKISFIGLGARCKGLPKLLANELGVELEVIDGYKEIALNRNLNRKQFCIAEYMTVIGATFAPLDFTMVAEGSKKAKGENKDSLVLPILVFAAGLIAGIAVTLLPFMENLELEMDNESMRSQIEKKQSIVEVYNKYLTLKVTDQNLAAADQNTNVPNDVFLDFLKEMETQMPSDMVVDSLSVAEDTMTISAVCSSKESTAEALMQLRTFDTILTIACGGVTEQVNEAGVTEYSFNITLVYTPAWLSPEENAGGGAEGADADAGTVDEELTDIE